MAQQILTSAEVRRLAARGRVRPSPRYHAHEHRVRYEDILAGLLRCAAIQKDFRTDMVDQRRHLAGYIAHAPTWDGGVLRVDCDATSEPDGIMLWVVTAFWVNQ